MNQFTIEPNQFLNISIKAFYHSDYFGGGDRWRIGGTIGNVICTLKNDIKAVDRQQSTDGTKQCLSGKGKTN